MVHETKNPVAEKIIKLPVQVASLIDVGRLIRELEAIDSALLQLSLRKSGHQARMPKTSQLMNQIIEHNKLNLLHKTDRQRLQQFLQAIKERAPLLHISFSADPSTVFLEKLMAWLRHEIHPQVLLTVGLQPTIGAGCMVRSTNHYFDLSLRQTFLKKRDLLLGKLVPETKKAEP